MIVQIYYIYNECYKKAHFPDLWKKADIIPIKKYGKDPRKTSSYRPISLLPILGNTDKQKITKHN